MYSLLPLARSLSVGRVLFLVSHHNEKPRGFIPHDLRTEGQMKSVLVKISALHSKDLKFQLKQCLGHCFACQCLIFSESLITYLKQKKNEDSFLKEFQLLVFMILSLFSQRWSRWTANPTSHCQKLNMKWI